ncbi:alpha/beta hydrolase [Bowmanella yangjiangensis]|uniref:Alpha/beta hydrolase n=1 Tax=Bowmanella yangjiangensis TaxID=2811230 RepID=A0ABS3CP98_9ALTE|nr:alpha/beta hydrolase [Bowmanella yangjiangensis]MBN7818291.1 alpha/beta hydrolase [Bowmanella yangjiangensis]
MLHHFPKFLLLMSLTFFMTSVSASAVGELPWQNTEKGHYYFSGWAGGRLDIQFSVPKDSHADTPVLLIIPGARRNAGQYRDHWHALALKYGFIVLAIGCNNHTCPTEYDYNLGGLQNEQGQEQALANQFFSAPELVFHDFVDKFASRQRQFALYGHSAGGGFVHLYMLARSNAPVSQAVSANAAFFTMPELQMPFPFGLHNTAFDAQDVNAWLRKPLTFMLADNDLGPRTKPLSNSEQANLQGRNVFARGLAFYAKAINWASGQKLQPTWALEVVHGVGHDSARIAPHAVKYLFPELEGR